MFKVIRRFEDTDGTVYEVNDEYKGDASEERLHTLSTKNNKYKKQYIVQVEENEPTDKEFPYHVGGGHYELSNGEKVRGKAKATESEKALKE